MTHDDLLHSLRTQLTVPVWPHAGKALGYKTKSAAYAAAARGAIQTIPDMGRKRPVATAWLRSVLFVESSPPPQEGGAPPAQGRAGRGWGLSAAPQSCGPRHRWGGDHGPR
jgi:hypothetical protein